MFRSFKREEPPIHLRCPITRELLEDPVITPYGQTYSRAAILRHLGTSETDPLTGQPLTMEKLIPNRQVRDAVAEFLKQCADVEAIRARDVAAGEDDRTPEEFLAIANCYVRGIGVPCNLAVAIRNYQKAAQMGNDVALCRLGIFYTQGKGVDVDYKKAAQHFLRSAEKNTTSLTGSQLATEKLLELLDTVNVGTPNDVAGEIYVVVGLCHEHGYGHLKIANGSAAQESYNMASLRDYPPGHYHLGRMMTTPPRGSINDEVGCYKLLIAAMYVGADEKTAKQAVERLSILAHGNPASCFAQTFLGECYENGYACVVDYAQARNLYTKAVEQDALLVLSERDRLAKERGHDIALCQLGKLYQDGRGVQQSADQAADYFFLAATLCTGRQEGSIKAITLLRKLSEQNASSKVFINLGLCYENGYGDGTKNLQTAFSCQLRAAQKFQRSDIAMYNVGRHYRDGKGRLKNESKAIEWFLKAAQKNTTQDNGTKEAIKQLKILVTRPGVAPSRQLLCAVAECHKHGYGGEVAKSFDEAKKYLLRAVDLYPKDILVKCALGDLYEDGICLARDVGQAAFWYFEAAKISKGVSEADRSAGGAGANPVESPMTKLNKLASETPSSPQVLLYVATCYKNGYACDISYSEAVRYYKQAALQGSDEAKCNVGLLYRTGGVDLGHDETQAAYWFYESAKQNTADVNFLGSRHAGTLLKEMIGEPVPCINALVSFAHCHQFGYGGYSRNSQEALRYYRKAAGQGDVATVKMLANRQFTCDGAINYQEITLAETLEWQFRIASSESFGVTERLSAVRVLLDSAATGAGGDLELAKITSNNLGECYEHGYPLGEKNIKKALTYYEKAAALCSDVAMCHLGRCYYNGLGVRRDVTRAIHWYHKSAETAYSIRSEDANPVRILSIERGGNKAIRALLAIEFESISLLQKKEIQKEEILLLLGTLGLCYEKGYAASEPDRSGRHPFAVAARYYERVAGEKDEISTYRLGELYLRDDWADAHFETAAQWFFKTVLLEKEHCKLAIQRLETIKEKHPDSAIVWRLLGQAYDDHYGRSSFFLWRRDSFKKAEIYYKEAIKRNDEAACYYLGDYFQHYFGRHEDACCYFYQAAKFNSQNETGTQGAIKQLMALTKEQPSSACAMTTLGLCYYHGYGVEKNIGSAIISCKHAADFGYRRAMAVLASIYRDQERPDVASSAYWDLCAAQQGVIKSRDSLIQLADENPMNVDVQEYLSLYYATQPPSPVHLKTYQNAALHGSGFGQYCLGKYYEEAHGDVEKDISKAAEHYGESIRLTRTFPSLLLSKGIDLFTPARELLRLEHRYPQNSHVLTWIGRCYQEGFIRWISGQDLKKAVYYYERAAALENDEAMCCLGLLCSNPEEAAVWLFRSAKKDSGNDLGSVRASKTLESQSQFPSPSARVLIYFGLCCQHGYGHCEQGYEGYQRARELYERAADLKSEGSSLACYYLAEIYLQGLGIQVDNHRAVECLTKAIRMATATSDEGGQKAFEKLVELVMETDKERNIFGDTTPLKRAIRLRAWGENSPLFFGLFCEHAIRMAFQAYHDSDQPGAIQKIDDVFLKDSCEQLLQHALSHMPPIKLAILRYYRIVALLEETQRILPCVCFSEPKRSLIYQMIETYYQESSHLYYASFLKMLNDNTVHSVLDSRTKQLSVNIVVSALSKIYQDYLQYLSTHVSFFSAPLQSLIRIREEERLKALIKNGEQLSVEQLYAELGCLLQANASVFERHSQLLAPIQHLFEAYSVLVLRPSAPLADEKYDSKYVFGDGAGAGAGAGAGSSPVATAPPLEDKTPCAAAPIEMWTMPRTSVPRTLGDCEQEVRSPVAQAVARLQILCIDIDRLASDDARFKDYICPISQLLMREPVQTSDGHLYEKNEIEEWLRTHDSSPVTLLQLKSKSLSPIAIAFRRQLLELLEDIERNPEQYQISYPLKIAETSMKL